VLAQREDLIIRQVAGRQLQVRARQLREHRRVQLVALADRSAITRSLRASSAWGAERRAGLLGVLPEHLADRPRVGLLSKTTRIGRDSSGPRQLGDLAQRVADAAALDRPAPASLTDK